jgi:actin-related protein
VTEKKRSQKEKKIRSIALLAVTQKSREEEKAQRAKEKEAILQARRDAVKSAQEKAASARAAKEAELKKKAEEASAVRAAAQKAREEEKAQRAKEKEAILQARRDAAKSAQEKAASARAAKEAELKKKAEEASAVRAAAQKAREEEKAQRAKEKEAILQARRDAAKSAQEKAASARAAKEAGLKKKAEELPTVPEATKKAEELAAMAGVASAAEVVKKLQTESSRARKKASLLAYLSVKKAANGKKKREKIPLKPAVKELEKDRAKEKAWKKKVASDHSRILAAATALGVTASKTLSAAKSLIATRMKQAAKLPMPSAEKILSSATVLPVPAKGEAIPSESAPVKKFKEPFKILPFLRRNIFRLMFAIFLLAWIGEILYYSMRIVDPRSKFEDAERSQQAKSSKDSVISETIAIDISTSSVKLDIEGKRDPFSTGALTMEVLTAPRATDMRYAIKPEIITLRKTPTIITPSSPAPAYGSSTKITPILKPDRPVAPTLPAPVETTVSALTPPKVAAPALSAKPEVSPLILPPLDCPLIYRGTLFLEGIEYLFLEGKNRTYRATVGDTVEGFRILRKEGKTIHLSKEGRTIELSAE